MFSLNPITKALCLIGSEIYVYFSQESGKLLRKPWPDEENVIGKACAVMYTVVFGGQIIAGFLCGPVSAFFDSSSAAMMLACVMAVISFMFAQCVELPTSTK